MEGNMLVQFYKGFTMEGETTFTEKKHFWSKPVIIKQKIYLHTKISGICDDTELEAVVEKLIKEKLEKTSGWGKDFTGWKRIVPYEECLKIAEERDWAYKDKLPKNQLMIAFLDDWTVKKAALELNDKQFAQYCKDYGIVLKIDKKEMK